ncbi:protein kinase [Cryptosporangium sp. NPDC048952]|uniref:protein kinase domain-containing protein n=1 Tax=Cryptosporangium sp. NPDC048952 TaxID=3363961 RepID=UPI00371118C6
MPEYEEDYDRLPVEVRENLSGPEYLAKGGQAVLWKARWHGPWPTALAADGDHEVVVKVYDEGRRTKEDVWEPWRALPPECAVPLIKFAYVNETDTTYEITQYLPHGSLKEYAARRGGNLDFADAKSLLESLYDAFQYIHDLQPADGHSYRLIHRDIKPDNLLVTGLDPLRVCLADFGIANLQPGMEVEAKNWNMRSAAYAPPDFESKVSSPAADWWSVGITLLEALDRHPFRKNDGWMERQAIVDRFHAGPIEVRLSDPRWTQAIRGLVTRAKSKRWGAAQVAEWLDDGNPRVRETGGDLREEPVFFAGDVLDSPAALAAAMARRWDAAAGLLLSPLEWDGIRTWARSVSATLGDALDDVDRQYVQTRQPVDRSITEVITRLNPSGHPVFREYQVTQPDLVDTARWAARGNAEAIEFLDALFDSGSLLAFRHLDDYRGLSIADVRWQRLCMLAGEAAALAVSHGPRARSDAEDGSDATLGALESALPGSSAFIRAELLNAALDEQHVTVLRADAAQLMTRQNLRVGWFRAICEEAERAERAQDPERAVAHYVAALVFRNVILEREWRVGGATLEQARRAIEDRRAIIEQRLRTFRTFRRLAGRTLREAIREVQLNRWRSQLNRWVGIFHGILTVLTAVGVAISTRLAVGLVVGALLAVCGGAIGVARSSSSARGADIALGTTIGAWIGFVAAAIIASWLTIPLGPAVGWPAFWLVWLGTTVLGGVNGSRRAAQHDRGLVSTDHSRRSRSTL